MERLNQPPITDLHQWALSEMDRYGVDPGMNVLAVVRRGGTILDKASTRIENRDMGAAALLETVLGARAHHPAYAKGGKQRQLVLSELSESIQHVVAPELLAPFELAIQQNGLAVARGRNIVTNSGDRYYSEEGAGSAPFFSVAGMKLGTGVTAADKTDIDIETVISGSELAIDGSYPTTNDSDTDNTGAKIDATTWRRSYSKTDFNQTGISEVAIVDNIGGAATNALMRAIFSPTWDKTSNDTAKVFVNHEFLGV